MRIAKKLNFKSITGIVWLLVLTPIVAQSQLSLSDKSTMSVTGTSSLHDWHSEIEKIITSAEATIQDGKLVSLDKLIINVPVKSIKSGKNAMDKNTYEALKEEDHPTIKFQLTSSEISGNTVTAKGKMAIAGKVQTVTLKADYAVSGSSISFKGEYTIDMNDYEIDPPTALMGTVTTGKDVTVHYNIIFNF